MKKLSNKIILANSNVLLRWIPKYGPNKGKVVEQWFNAPDEDVKRLIIEFNAKIIKVEK